MFFQAARSAAELKAPLLVQSPHIEWIYIKSKNNKNETGSRYFQKWPILPNARGVLQFKIERRPRTTPKTQDLNPNQTRNLQKIAPGPDLAARAKRLEITFIYRKGAEGPPTFTRGPVRARALSTPGKKNFTHSQQLQDRKCKQKIFFEKNFQINFFLQNSKKSLTNSSKPNVFSSRESPQDNTENPGFEP